MNENKIIVKTESSNLWWGIYGLAEKTGWEDLELFYGSGERIGYICLNTKGYLRNALEDLLKKEDEKEFSVAVQNYLEDNICHYWFYYDEIKDDHFFEVPYDAPKNRKGIKPCLIDVWHPDEGIDIKTIESAVSSFAKDFLKIEDCIVETMYDESLEDSIKSLKLYQEKFGDGNVKIEFSEELILELSKLWEMEKEQVLDKLKLSL